MTPERKRQIFNGIGLGLSALFIYLCWHFVKEKGATQVFAIHEIAWLAPVLLLNFAVMAIRTQVWRVLLKPLQELPFGISFDLLHLGYMANNLLPLKAGDFLRASFTAKKWKLPYTQVLTTVGLERYFAGSSLLLLFLAVAYGLPIPLWLKSSAWVLTLILGAFQLSLWILWKRSERLEQWQHRHPWINRIAQTLSHIGKSSQLIQNPKPFLTLFGLTLLTWLLQVGMLKMIEWAYHLEVGWLGSAFVLVAINLAVAIPSAPGNLGTFEFATMLAYRFLGIDEGTALGIAIFFHFIQVVPVTLLGLFYYFRWGVQLRGVPSS